jgi:hypothetical protein
MNGLPFQSSDPDTRPRRSFGDGSTGPLFFCACKLTHLGLPEIDAILPGILFPSPEEMGKGQKRETIGTAFLVTGT